MRYTRGFSSRQRILRGIVRVKELDKRAALNHIYFFKVKLLELKYNFIYGRMNNLEHHTKLQPIFEKYKNTGTACMQEIISRQYCFCPIDKKVEVIICGINPSYRKNANNVDEPFEFCFQDSYKNQKDPYYKKFPNYFDEHWTPEQIGYTDLFYFRRTDQKDINIFFENGDGGLQFLVEQLQFTQEKLESVQPKLICLFNRGAAAFFGKHANPDAKSGKRNLWMGYTFEPTSEEDLYKITGISLDDECIKKNKSTNLVGTYILFSRFLGNGMPNAMKPKIKAAISWANESSMSY